MSEIHLVIEGEPIAKRRHRVAIRGKRAIAYSDQKGEETAFKAHLLSQIPYGFKMLEGPLSVDCVFYKSRPKSHYGTGRNSGRLKPSAPALPITTPDSDNYCKFANDAMNDLIFVDDRQIVDSSEKKRFSRYPRTEICVSTIRDNGGVNCPANLNAQNVSGNGNI